MVKMTKTYCALPRFSVSALLHFPPSLMETGWQFVTATSQDQLVSILHMSVKPCGLAKVLFERGGMIFFT